MVLLCYEGWRRKVTANKEFFPLILPPVLIYDTGFEVIFLLKRKEHKE
jgi:hypothetical protein